MSITVYHSMALWHRVIFFIILTVTMVSVVGLALSISLNGLIPEFFKSFGLRGSFLSLFFRENGVCFIRISPLTILYKKLTYTSTQDA